MLCLETPQYHTCLLRALSIYIETSLTSFGLDEEDKQVSNLALPIARKVFSGPSGTFLQPWYKW